MHPTRFDSLAALARLPWFDLDETGALVRAPRDATPAIDTHAHLALAYVLPGQVDLAAETPETRHYLPEAWGFDLDVYANRNFRPADLREMKRDLTLRSLTARGLRKTHTAGNLLREMQALGLSHSVILPIDFPLLSDNASAALSTADTTGGRLVSFASVHPYALRPEAALDAQLARGARGLKVHPAVQMVRPDDPLAMRLYRLAGERDLPVLWHCGPAGIEPVVGRFLSQVRWYERPLREHPRTTFLLGHSGCTQPDAALELHRRYPNAWLELSCQSVSSLRRILRRADPTRLVFGSDWPFYPQAFALAKVLIATEGDPALRDRILYGNAARLLKLA